MPRCLILGDEIGIPSLIKLANKLEYEIVAFGFSRKTENSQAIKFRRQLKQSIEVNDARDIMRLIELDLFDVGIIFSFDVILPSSVLRNETVKFINIHGGKLPEYRGANVLNWAIIRGDSYLGIAIHEVAARVDSGNIIAQWEIPINNDDTALTMRYKLCEQVELVAPSKIDDYMVGRITPVPQNDMNAVVWRRRRPEDGTINWNSSDEEIYNLIRALVPPWPGARYYDSNGTLVIIKSKLSLKQIKKIRAENT